MLRTLASRGSRALGVASRRMTTVTEPGPVGLYAGDNPRQVSEGSRSRLQMTQSKLSTYF